VLPFPQTFVGRVAWLSSAAAAVTACVLLGLTVKEAAPIVLGASSVQIPATPAIVSNEQFAQSDPVPSPPKSATDGEGSRSVAKELADAVYAANEASSAKCSELVDYWRGELRDLRYPYNLHAFVKDLTSVSQKYHQGLGLLDGHSGHDSVLTSFRKLVIDERELAAGLRATVQKYVDFLAEQDRQLLRTAGVSDEHRALVEVSIPLYTNWSRAMEPVIAAAVDEARRDMDRFTSNWEASNALGDRIRRGMRGLGVDQSKPGSWGDKFLDVVTDLGAGVGVDTMTDPTDRIMKRLSEEMIRAEQAMLDGESGLAGQLHKVKSFHEQARTKLLASAIQQ
jgi:hypothetical protein